MALTPPCIADVTPSVNPARVVLSIPPEFAINATSLRVDDPWSNNPLNEEAPVLFDKLSSGDTSESI